VLKLFSPTDIVAPNSRPEPAAFVPIGCGLAGLSLLRRKIKSRLPIAMGRSSLIASAL